MSTARFLNAEPALVRRLIDIVFELTAHENVEIRTYARSVIKEITEVVVAEVFEPILTLPRDKLLPQERFLRNRLSLAMLNASAEKDLDLTRIHVEFDVPQGD